MKNGTIEITYYKYIKIVQYSNIIDDFNNLYNSQIESSINELYSNAKNQDEGLNYDSDKEILDNFLRIYIEKNTDHIKAIEKELGEYKALLEDLNNNKVYIDIDDLIESKKNINEYKKACLDFENFLIADNMDQKNEIIDFIENFF